LTRFSRKRPMLSQIETTIREGKRFLITTHIDPDGDALGSVFSLAWVLKSLGKESVVYLKDQMPYRYDFLPRPNPVIHRLAHEKYDAIFVLDCGDLSRVGQVSDSLHAMGPLVNIDHHETNEAFARINLVDPGASSTGEILCNLYASMKLDVTEEMAINLYTAVFTDTGSLRYDNASVAAYAICTEMIELGVKPSYVSRMVYENHPKERFRLLGEVFCTLRTFDNDRIAMAHVTADMFRKTGTDRAHTDGFAEEIKQIRGVEVAILMRQVDERRYKISMRSKGTVDVAEICNRFDGGGHKNAAGCQIDGDLEAVERELKKAFNIS